MCLCHSNKILESTQPNWRQKKQIWLSGINYLARSIKNCVCVITILDLKIKLFENIIKNFLFFWTENNLTGLVKINIVDLTKSFCSMSQNFCLNQIEFCRIKENIASTQANCRKTKPIWLNGTHSLAHSTKNCVCVIATKF